MKILIVNAGSSSLKYQLVDMQDESVLAKGLVERIGIPGSKLTQKYPGSDKKYVIEMDMPTHVEACRNMLSALTDTENGVVKSMDEIGAVGHRVLHGGEKFTQSVVIDDAVMDAIRENIPLGPLHNPANLMGIEACQKVMPGTPMVAVFDTAFHQTMPPKAFMYGVPMKYYTNLHVRRYGFHGTSHRYVSARAAEFLGRKAEDLRIITCHLGNGSSIDEMLEMLNKKSGLLGLSGISSDMRDIDAAADQGDRNASIARDMLIYGIRKYIGAYAAAMNGVDVIVFTAGIGENGIEMREKVMEGFEFLGAKIDVEKNRVKGEERDISAADSKVKVLVIPTNEEIVIARDTLHLVTGK